MRPEQTPGAMPPQLETLPDTRPFTLAAAYLRHRKLADVSTYFDVSCGKEQFRDPKPERLRHWREEFYEFQKCVYHKMHNEELFSHLVTFLNRQTFYGESNKITPVRVTNAVATNVIGQLRAMCQVFNVDALPAWIDGEGRPPSSRVVAFTNGLLDIDEWLDDEGTPLQASTPDWLSVTCLPRAYDPTATCPTIVAFLKDVLEDDDQVDLFQEWCGLMVTTDTSFQRMLWLHGVGGGGKGTCAKLITALVGKESCASFGLFDLMEKFTLSSFTGKTVAISHDAHLGNSADTHRVIEHILAISGEDDRNIDRKNRDMLQGIKLSTRLVIVCNGFPQLPDAGIALRRRSLILSFRKTFEKVKDRKLSEKFASEMSGFTIWALRGLRRLMERGDFVQTRRGLELLDRLSRLSSPVRSFGDDCCEFPAIGADIDQYRVLKRHLYGAWKWWQQSNGHKPISFNTFSERIYEAFPTVKAGRPLVVTSAADGSPRRSRSHTFEGIKLTKEAMRHVATDDQLTSMEEDSALTRPEEEFVEEDTDMSGP